MHDKGSAGEDRPKMPLSQRLLLWMTPVAVAIALPINFFAGFTVMLVGLGLGFIAFLMLLRFVSGAERRRGTAVRETESGR